MDSRIKILIVIIFLLLTVGTGYSQTRGALVNPANIVVNVVIVDDPSTWTPPPGLIFVASDTAQQRDIYDGTNFTSGPPIPPPRDFRGEYEAIRATIPPTPTRAALDLLAEKIGIFTPTP